VWLRFDDLGDATVTATDVGAADLMPGAHAVSVVAATSGCGAAPGLPLIALALVASMRRRARHVV
jgi:uncharacterized protein (TIGR03382 family)